LNGGRHKVDDENLSLASQAKKGKFKKFANGESTSQEDKKDMRKVKYYACRKFGHYANQCLNKNKGGNKMQPEVVASPVEIMYLGRCSPCVCVS